MGGIRRGVSETDDKRVRETLVGKRRARKEGKRRPCTPSHLYKPRHVNVIRLLPLEPVEPKVHLLVVQVARPLEDLGEEGAAFAEGERVRAVGVDDTEGS